MLLKHPWLLPALAILLLLGLGGAHGAGLGENASGAVLGQPLDFSVQLRLDANEALTADCVAAEVTAGDRRLPAASVRTALQLNGPGTARVRITTTQAMDEPVIGVVLNVGCQSRISRRYVVLADPPAEPAPAAPASLPFVGAAGLPLSVTAGGAVASPAGAPAGLGGAEPPPARVAAARQATGPRSATAASRRATGKNVAPTGPRATARAAAAKAAEPGREKPLAAPVPVPARAVAAAPARLRLDVMEPSPTSTRGAATAAAATAAATAAVADAAATASAQAAAQAAAEAAAVETAMQAVAQAASAARAAASAAFAADERIANLERTVAQLRGESLASRDLAAKAANNGVRAPSAALWLWPLLVALVLMAGLAAWMAWQMATLRRVQQQTWQQASALSRRPPHSEPPQSKQPTAPIPFVTSEIALPSAGRPQARAMPAPAWPPPLPAQAPVLSAADSDFANSTIEEADRGNQRTLPMLQAMSSGSQAAAASAGGKSALRDVSIEELIDLEQQAEFFVVLGQDEAAIDLLVEHLRSTGGSSPLPYLKLLEIHHRRGHREAYDRTRSRFNQRFNAYAPDWDAGLQHGRSLEDYAGILPRLQRVWPLPLDAMAELEALLFRRSRGELFDLPAYRDVLFLYALARELMDHEAARSGDVDLLLPLSDGGQFRSTAPHPYFGLDHDSVFDRSLSDDMPTAPVDLDLTISSEPLRIVDPLSASPPIGRA